MASMADRRKLLASIHDVSPRFESEMDALVDLLQTHVGDRIAMLVVPNHWGDAPIVPGSRFAARLRSWAERGFEMFLHGFYHRDQSSHASASDRVRARFMTAGEGEFLGLSTDEARIRLDEGRRLLEDVIGKPMTGFVAPAWLYGPGAHRALTESHVAIAEDHLRVWSPASGKVLARGPVITWASRSKARLASSLAAASALRRAPINALRVGVHPPDIRHAALVRSIDETLRIARRKRTASGYADLLRAGSGSEFHDEGHGRLA
jgi:predicted deacetylase